VSILLYYSPGSGAQVPHVLLEEAVLDYELRRLDAREPPSGEQPLLRKGTNHEENTKKTKKRIITRTKPDQKKGRNM